MVSPYRAGQPPKALQCPRCNKPLPPTEVAACVHGCGTWVSQFASTEVLTETDRKPDPVTRWWRVRAPCPMCGEKMALCGEEPGLFQGCEQHGYFIDADTIEHTGLGRGVDHAAIEAKRADSARVEAEREAIAEVAERQRKHKLEIEAREAGLGARVDEIKRQETAKDDRRAKTFRLLAAGVNVTVANYILDLEDRIASLERRLEETERGRKL
jgi:hypothetical protein